MKTTSNERVLEDLDSIVTHLERTTMQRDALYQALKELMDSQRGLNLAQWQAATTKAGAALQEYENA